MNPKGQVRLALSRLVQWFGVATLLVASAEAQTASQVTLTPVSSFRFDAQGDDAEGDLNCDEIRFPRAGLVAVVQNRVDSGPEFSAFMRERGKILAVETVLKSDSELAGHYADGVLYAVEFDWFFLHEGAPTPDRLPGHTLVYSAIEGGGTELVARVFGYTKPQYVSRKAVIEAMVDHSMRVFPVWAEDVLTVSSGIMVVTGLDNEFHGRLGSGGHLGVLGIHNDLRGGIAVRNILVLRQPNSVSDVEHVAALSVPEVRISEERARRLARNRGTYVPGDLVITAENVPRPGPIFAEGSITLQADGLEGRWSLMAGGQIAIRGDANVLRPHLGGVVAASFGGRVVVAGDANDLAGAVFAPRGSLEVTGSGNTLVGVLAAEDARITGSENLFSDGTHAIAR